MPGSSYLLDTNIFIAYLNGEEPVGERFDREPGLAMCAVVFAELYYGALKSGRVEENIRRVEALASRFGVLGIDMELSRVCASLRRELDQTGRPIPSNDLWIAATARRFGLTLVTRDDHFRDIEALQVETW